MVTISVNGQQFDVEAGRPLVEVVKELGFYLSNLCYIDGLPPYAGCRTCVVEIEGMRGLPLACTTLVQDGMAVRTETEAVVEMRQQVMALILANHSDRCLTCHRVKHCRTGDLCLRDNVVTHRCVTCSKNYRCELQTASDVADVGRANIEPYLDEVRSFYQWEQPDADRSNPFLEFDPQMCIICTRCVRACDDLRHTTAISLAGRGFSTRIAFGSGGTIDESNCDFCGSCIDVCPTATLMEAPNKWVARPDAWVNTTCTECALGCTIQMGVKDGRGIQVRPSAGNDVSRDQICVRGRFGYDQVRDKDRLPTGRLGRGQDAFNATADAVLSDASTKLAAIIAEHGPRAVGLLGSGQASNEDNYLVRKLADVIGTPNVDSSSGYVWSGVAEALRDAFGSEHLPNRLTAIEDADLIVVIADDLSSSNNVLGVRVKDAVTLRGARLVTIGRRASALEFHATHAMRAPNGDLAAATRALSAELRKDSRIADRLTELAQPESDAPDAAGAPEAAQALTARLSDNVAIVFAPSRHSATAAAAQARAAVNLAITLAGPDQAASRLHVLPPEANVIGLRDMGVIPNPALSEEDDDGNATTIEEAGLDLSGMLAAAREGSLRALIVAKDNPILLLPDRAAVRESLESLELLLVIDDVAGDTVNSATHVLADMPLFGKDGSTTNADRQILRLRPATAAARDARPAWQHLQDLAQRLTSDTGAGAPAFADAAAVMDAIASEHPAYAGIAGSRLIRQTRQPSNGTHAPESMLAPDTLSPGGAGLALITSRDLYTDREAAAARIADADRLHRSETLTLHPSDAEARGITDGDTVQISANGATVSIPAQISDDIDAGSAFLPLLWDAGRAMELIGADEPIPMVEVVKG